MPDIVELQMPMVFGEPIPLIQIPANWSLDKAPHFELVRMPNWVQQGLTNAAGVLLTESRNSPT